MQNGYTWTVKVTDAQISTHVITADGEDFVITVTYGSDAQIPEGARLEADEIVPGSQQYNEYIEKAREAIRLEKTPDQDGDSI